MGTNNNVTAELCHAICVMQTCQGSARYKISEFFLECTIGLYDMRVHNNSSFPSSVFMSVGGGIMRMLTWRQLYEKGEENHISLIVGGLLSGGV